MKKCIAVILSVLILLVSLCSCSSGSFLDIFTDKAVENPDGGKLPAGETPKGEQHDVAALLENVTSDYIVDVFTDDYDLDEALESYVLTSENPVKEGEVHADGLSLWFIKRGKVTKLLDNGNYSLSPRFFKFSDKTLFCIDDYSGVSPCSVVYFVSGGSAYSYGDFGAKLVRAGDDRNDFYAWVGAQDSIYRTASSEFSGSTLKPYYLYFDGNFFCEYAGILMSKERLMEYSGAEQILTAISEGGYTVGDIFYRNNGIININISKETQAGTVMLENATLIVSGDKVYLLARSSLEDIPFEALGNTGEALQVIADDFADTESFSFGGLYTVSAFPDLETYPEKFG